MTSWNAKSSLRTALLTVVGAITLTPIVMLADAPPTPADSPARQALLQTWDDADHALTPAVQAAFLRSERVAAEADLAAAGESIPTEFLDWVDATPIVASTVYGIKHRPANVLRILRSLELDLGERTVREDYLQLALAFAVTYADVPDLAAPSVGVHLAAREPLTLVIPPSPLKRVDTRDPNRTLDVHDHVINFLEDHPIPVNAKTDTDATQTRPATAADLLKSKALQEAFNTYMQAQGQTLRIDCEPPQFEMPNNERNATTAAAQIFERAYVAKGLLTSKRDPLPTLAESMAFIVRNDRFRFPPEANRKWPRFPLREAPWPTLVFLVQERLPLRELEDMWQRFVSEGKPLESGVRYLGKIAQKPPMLRAASLAPSEFHYGSAQMNVKDGGVCGAQSKTWAMIQQVMGIPATTASSPTHSGKSQFRYATAEKTVTFIGPGTATPVPWVFDNPVPNPKRGNGRTPMVRHHTTAFGINYDFQRYLDSFIAQRLYEQLPENERTTYGKTLLESGLDLNPYNSTLLSSLANASSAIEAVRLTNAWEAKIPTLVEGKAGCPKTLFILPERTTAKIAAEPPPEDAAAQEEILAYLTRQKDPNVGALARYRALVQGTDEAGQRFESDLAKHLAAERKLDDCREMEKRFVSLAKMMEPEERKEFAQRVWDATEGRRLYLIGGVMPRTDDVVAAAAKMLRRRLPPQSEMIAPILAETTTQWEQTLASQRSARRATVMAQRLRRMIPLVQDDKQREAWRAQLLELTADRKDLAIPRDLIAKAGWKVVDVSRQGNKRELGLLAIDGNPKTAWVARVHDQNDADMPQFLIVDMGTAQTLAGFTCVSRMNNNRDIIATCALYLSDDGKSWHLAAETTPDTPATPWPKAGVVERRLSFSPAEARFFKLVVTGSGDKTIFPTITEIAVVQETQTETTQ